MLILRRVVAVLGLVIGVLLAAYGAANTVRGVVIATSVNTAQGAGFAFGAFAVGVLGFYLGKFSLRLWNR